jgi:hypothetical protein
MFRSDLVPRRRTVNADQFRASAETDEQLGPYLETLLEEASPLVPDRTANFDFLLALLAAVAARSLYVSLSELAANRPLLDEATLRQRLQSQADAFAATGATQTQIADVIAAVSSAMTVRPPNEEEIPAGLALLRGEATNL